MAGKSERGTDRTGEGRPEVAGGFDGPDVIERGAPVEGASQALDARLFVQLQVFTGALETDPAVQAVREGGLPAAVYASVNDPRGLGVVVMSESPDDLVGAAREMYTRPPFSALAPLPDLTMIGRTYAIGREKDLRDWLLNHARRQVLDTENAWAVWYPLRRSGAFSRLPRHEQGKMLGEHAGIGRAYGEAGLARDIRLECHGLDRDDNEFVVGLVGPRLHPLSKLVKQMRPTRQTSEYIERICRDFRELHRGRHVGRLDIDGELRVKSALRAGRLEPGFLQHLSQRVFGRGVHRLRVHRRALLRRLQLRTERYVV